MPPAARTAVVTGTARPTGIGRACARAFIKAGYNVLGVDKVRLQDAEPGGNRGSVAAQRQAAHAQTASFTPGAAARQCRPRAGPAVRTRRAGHLRRQRGLLCAQRRAPALWIQRSALPRQQVRLPGCRCSECALMASPPALLRQRRSLLHARLHAQLHAHAVFASRSAAIADPSLPQVPEAAAARWRSVIDTNLTGTPGSPDTHAQPAR
jgi:NAD(P)-dependent dehydrogenase (short-subunit alcohol dehydrogenase family)